MKNAFLLLVLVALFAFFTTCKDDNPVIDEEPTLSVDQKGPIDFTDEGGTVTINVVSNTNDWNVSSDQTWCKVSKSGNTFVITAAANTSEQASPEATVTVIARIGEKTVSEKITVRQSGKYIPPQFEGVEYKLAPNTIALTKNQLDNIAENDTINKTLTYKENTPSEEILTVGQQFFVYTPGPQFPNGLLAKAVKVSDKGNQKVVTYEYIELGDAFKTLHVEAKNIDLTDAVYKVVDANGKEIGFTKSTRGALPAGSIALSIPEIALYNADETLGGKFNFKVTMTWKELKIDFEDYTLTNFNFDMDNQVEIGIGMEASIKAATEDEENRKKICSFYLNSITIGPVVLTPRIDVWALIGAEGKITFSAEVKYAPVINTTLTYDGWEWNADIKGGGQNDNQKSPFTFNGAFALSGDVYGGISLEPNISIYYKAFEFTFEGATKLHLKGVVNFDLSAYQDEKSWYSAFKDSKVSVNLGLEGAAKVKTLSKQLAKVTATLADVPLSERYIVPRVADKITVALKSGSSTDYSASFRVTNNLLFATEVGTKIFKKEANGGYNYQKPFQILAMGNHTNLPPNAKEQVYTTDIINLQEATTYLAAPYFKIFGIDYTLENYATEFTTAKKLRYEAELRAILMDIYNSCSNKDKLAELNWGSNKTITEWGGVVYEESADDGTVSLSVKVSLEGNIVINSHTEGLEKVKWYLPPLNDDLLSLTITDPHFERFGYITNKSTYLDSKNLKRLVIHSPAFTKQLDFDYTYCLNLEYLDLSECTFSKYEINLSFLPKLNTIILRDCPNLTTFDASKYPSTPPVVRTINDIDFTGSNQLKEVIYSKFNFASQLILKTSSTVSLTVKDVTAGDSKILTIRDLDNINALAVFSKSPYDDVNISNCKQLRSIYFEVNDVSSSILSDLSDITLNAWGSGVNKLTVSECKGNFNVTNLSIDEMEIVKSPELTDLKAASCGLKKFTIDGGKNLKSLNLGNNELTSLNLPPVNFPVLMSLNCGDNKITALNLPPENFPALMSLNCENNKITALVPKIFDWIKSSGGRVSYDKRYEYKNCVMVKDNGVGFWYPGEPESGCHAAKCDCQPPK